MNTRAPMGSPTRQRGFFASSLARRASLVLLAATVLLLPACYQQMANHAGYKPLTADDFFPDGRASRPVVEGTVARGQLRADTALYDGKDAKGEFVTEFPFEMNRQVLERGKERYNIFCTPCHGLTGKGDGRIVQRGFTKPPNYHTDLSRGYALKSLGTKAKVPLLTEAPPGYLYDVITRGFGAMPDHAAQVPVRDRWAITGYLRALQYSQSPLLREKNAEEKAKKGDKK